MNNQNLNSDQAETNNIESNGAPALHEPFSWLMKGKEHDENAQFAALTMDICRGVQTCLELVNMSTLNRQLANDEEPPVLNVPDTEKLLRLALASIEIMGDRAETHVGYFNRTESAKSS